MAKNKIIGIVLIVIAVGLIAVGILFRSSLFTFVGVEQNGGVQETIEMNDEGEIYDSPESESLIE